MHFNRLQMLKREMVLEPYIEKARIIANPRRSALFSAIDYGPWIQKQLLGYRLPNLDSAYMR